MHGDDAGQPDRGQASADAEEPDVSLVASTEWRSAAPPLTDRPNVGKRSETSGDDRFR
jgi:hypothetical protein